MELLYKPRNFYPDEQRILKTLKNRAKKPGGAKFKPYHFLLAGLSGAAFTCIATILPDGFWLFLCGTIAVFSFAFVVFTPFEIYKIKKRNKADFERLNTFIESGTVSTCLINAKRIAIAKEYEDESDLYIIELDTDQLLFLWDHGYNLHKKLPCLSFELYGQAFSQLLEREVYALSTRIEPIIIDPKAKWNYMSQSATPEHRTIRQTGFDEFIEQMMSCA